MVSELVVEIPNIQLVIVGATDRGGIEFIRLASQLIPGNFVYLGTVSSQTNRKTLFENMSVFCLPSDSENYALAAVEIAALGLPCIVSMHTGAFQPNLYPNVQLIDSQRMDLWKLALLELSENSATKNVLKSNNHLAEWTRYSSEIIEFMG
jgi:glycosyltransferase involved in cell wall biosynthesis